MKVQTSKSTTDQVCEILRDGLLNSLKYGSCLAVNMDTYNPDFHAQYNKPDDNFDTNLIFNREKFLDN